MTEREGSLSQLRQKIDALTCEGCHNDEPITLHDGTPESLKALKGKKMHSACGICTAKGDVIISLVSAREASIVKAAYTRSAQEVDQCNVEGPYEAIAADYRIRALTPESALLGAQIAELEARHTEAIWWRYLAIMNEDSYFAAEGDKRIADLESQLQRLTAELAKVEGVMPQPAKLDHPKH